MVLEERERGLRGHTPNNVTRQKMHAGKEKTVEKRFELAVSVHL